MACHGDVLFLNGAPDQRLSGTVSAIQESGVVELVSPLADKPLKLKGDAVSSIRFRDEVEGESGTDMLAILSNGDQLPVVIESLEPKRGLIGNSPALGSLTLPSSALRALEFGVKSRRVFFRGPGEITEWTGAGNRQSFSGVNVVNGEWQIAGSSVANRVIVFPKDFVLSFRLKWKSDSQPNLRFFFCGEGTDDGKPGDRYLLQFASAGLEIKRESAEGQRFPSILISNRLPDSFPDRKVDIEIHVSRTTGSVQLYLDGELEARGIDPVAKRPKGGYLSMQFNGAPNVRQDLADLMVTELDNLRLRHRMENRGNKDLDALISRDDQRWSGSVKAIRKAGNGTEIVFDHPQSPQPIEISVEDASTLFFRNPESAGESDKKAFQLHLAGEGLLSVGSCRIVNDRVTARHSVLGDLTFPKSALLRIERMPGITSKKPPERVTE